MENPWSKFDGLPTVWIAEKTGVSCSNIYRSRSNYKMSKGLRHCMCWLDLTIQGWRPIHTVNKMGDYDIAKMFGEDNLRNWRSGRCKPTQVDIVQKLYELWEELK